MEGKSKMFDTHAHYDHELFGGKGPELLRELLDRNVLCGAVIPAITYESNFNRIRFPKEDFPSVYFAAGLHPKCAVNEAVWKKDRLEQFLSLAEDERTVALKTGLDFCKKKLTDAQKEHQKFFLKQMIGTANHYKLPLVFHVRDAAGEFTEFLKENPPETEAVVHCFTGGPETARAMMDVGVTRFGIGGMLTRDEMEPLRDCVKELPLSRILLETDAPFVRPKGYEGELNTSETLPRIAGLIAELKGISAEDVVRAAYENAAEFYRL